uniref:Shisa family member 4 n=1 Tax=Pundamilia nyererei TaxID=303518 RepID=A0A3B4G5I2_9CICH
MIFPGGNMPLISVTLAVLAVVLSTSQVSGNEQCLWYVDKNGTWHNGFDCPLITFCCGNCNRRYCCLDAFKMITEREQKRCMLFQFSPTTLAGIASSILLFVAIIATMVCCFMCSCCYLYQRRQQRGRTPYDGETSRCRVDVYADDHEVWIFLRNCAIFFNPQLSRSPWPATRLSPCTMLMVNQFAPQSIHPLVTLWRPSILACLHSTQ